MRAQLGRNQAVRLMLEKGQLLVKRPWYVRVLEYLGLAALHGKII